MPRVTISLADDKEPNYSECMGGLVMALFHARTDAHLMHLSTSSFAKHKALNEFYDEIIDLVDSLVETFQGSYGIITEYPNEYFRTCTLGDPKGMLEGLRKHVEGVRSRCCSETDTHLQNIIDEVMSLIQSTLYKLRFLS